MISFNNLVIIIIFRVMKNLKVIIDKNQYFIIIFRVMKNIKVIIEMKIIKKKSIIKIENNNIKEIIMKELVVIAKKNSKTLEYRRNYIRKR